MRFNLLRVYKRDGHPYERGSEPVTKGVTLATDEDRRIMAFANNELVDEIFALKIKLNYCSINIEGFETTDLAGKTRRYQEWVLTMQDDPDGK